MVNWPSRCKNSRRLPHRFTSDGTSPPTPLLLNERGVQRETTNASLSNRFLLLSEEKGDNETACDPENAGMRSPLRVDQRHDIAMTVPGCDAGDRCPVCHGL